MTRIADAERVSAKVEHLRRLATTNGGRVPSWAVAGVAKSLGCSERSVWNWLDTGVPGQRYPTKLSDKELVVVAERQGDRKAAWRQLAESGAYTKSYAQFWRELNNVDPITRTGVTEGVKKALQRGLYLKDGTTIGRLDRVIFDHTEMDIFIRRSCAGRDERFRPWISLLLDARQRFVLSAVVTEGDGVKGDPGTETLVALLARLIHGEVATDGTFVGGVPHVVQCDNAKAHLAEAMVNGYAELGISVRLIEPASPWQDGRVERLMKTVRDEFLRPLPGYTGAFRDRFNHDAWEMDQLLTMDQLIVMLDEFIDHYNYTRVHSALGTTPFEAWRDDPTPIERVDDDVIRHGFQVEARGRRVSANGIRFRGVDYIHPHLGKHPLHGSLSGREVHLRFLPNDRSFVDVYLGEEFICTAVPHERLSRAERQRVVKQRKADVRHVDHLLKQGKKRARQRFLDAEASFAPERDPLAPAADATLADADDEGALLAAMERRFAGKGVASDA